MGAIEVELVTRERWGDVVDLFERRGPRGGTPITAGCWCQFWRVRGNAWWDGYGSGHRRKLREELRRGALRALVAYADGEAVGWCRFGPRETFDRLEHSPKLARVDDEPVWAIVCFYVHPSAKRRGVASKLLDGVLRQARADGIRIVEAYPVAEGHANIDAYTGYLPMFLDAGFEVVREAGRRFVVRRRLRVRRAVPPSSCGSTG